MLATYRLKVRIQIKFYFDNRYYENLPCGWKICSISDIAYLRTGATFDKANVLPSNKNAGIRVLRGGNISTYKIDFRADDIFIPTAIVNPAIHVQQYDIITPAVTSLENIGKMARIHTKPTSNYTVGGFVYLLTPLFYNDTFSKFLLYQFTSTWFIRQLQEIAKKSGAAFYNINKTKFNGLPVYIPPLAEQARIVKRIEELLAQIDIIEQNQADIDTLYEEFKKRTLTLAIQGKLVPQDPNDEPASVLLERIRAEKKAKLGKKYVDSYIYKGDDNCYYEKVGETVTNISNEIPFDLPENWSYSRLETMITLLSGRDLEPNQYNSQRAGIPYITGASNIEHGSLIINRWTTNSATISRKGDLLITCKGTVGTMALNNVGDIHIARQIMAINADGVCLNYIRLFLESHVRVLQNKAKSFIPGISRQYLLKAIMPIPPFNEQLRIVEQYKTIYKQLKDED